MNSSQIHSFDVFKTPSAHTLRLAQSLGIVQWFVAFSTMGESDSGEAARLLALGSANIFTFPTQTQTERRDTEDGLRHNRDNSPAVVRKLTGQLGD
jgi:hypothetical protein